MFINKFPPSIVSLSLILTRSTPYIIEKSNLTAIKKIWGVMYYARKKSLHEDGSRHFALYRYRVGSKLVFLKLYFLYQRRSKYRKWYNKTVPVHPIWYLQSNSPSASFMIFTIKQSQWVLCDIYNQTVPVHPIRYLQSNSPSASYMIFTIKQSQCILYDIYNQTVPVHHIWYLQSNGPSASYTIFTIK